MRLKCWLFVGNVRVGSLVPTRFTFPHAILMRFNLRRIAAN